MNATKNKGYKIKLRLDNLLKIVNILLSVSKLRLYLKKIFNNLSKGDLKWLPEREDGGIF